MAGQDLILNFKVNDLGSAALNKMQDGIKGVQSAINLIKTSTIVYLGKEVLRTAGQIYQFVEAGAKVKSIEDSFNLMARNSGISIDNLISNLKKATSETIDDSDLMKKATRLMAEGFSSEQITVIGSAARTAARLMGTDVSAAYEQISDAVVNLRERGLKTAGFVIDLETAYEKHAKTLGVNKDALNDYGKQMAIAAAIEEKNIELQKKLNIEGETSYESMQRQKSALKDVIENLQKMGAAIWDVYFARKALTPIEEAAPGEIAAEVAAMEILNDSFERRGRLLKEQAKFFTAEEHGIGAGRGAPVKPQIKVDEYALKYGMSEAELKERLSTSRLLREGMYEQWHIEGKIIEIENDLAQVYAEDMFPSMEKVRQIVEKGNEDYKKSQAILTEMQGLVKNFGWEDYATGADAANEGTRELNRTMIQNVKALEPTELQRAWATLSENISSAWNFNVIGILRGTEKIGDAFKNMVTGMADAFTSAISKMIVQWILFGSITGKSEKGGGSLYGGLWGGVLGIVRGLFGTESTAAISSPTGGREIGPGTVPALNNGRIPIEGGGSQGVITHYHVYSIQAVDAPSFIDLCRRNPNAILSVVGEDANGAGTMRNVIRGIS
jgi:hypothetical protein